MTQTESRLIGSSDTSNAMEVAFRSGMSYEVTVRGHRMAVDQPVDAGGRDEGPTPTELFVASLAACVAYYAGQYLTRHGYSRDGLGVTATYQMATSRPARVSDIRLTVHVPNDLPSVRLPALRAVVSHCTVHNSLESPPNVRINLTR